MNKEDLKFRLSFLFVVGMPMISGCGDSLMQAEHNSISRVDTNVVTARDQVPDGHFSAVVVKSADQGWTSTTVHIGKDVSQLSFANAKRGWAVGKSSVYETSNGNAWTVINANINLLKQGDEIVKLEFGNDGIGWLVFQHNAADEFSSKDQIIVYRSLDSGKTWDLSVSQASATFSDLRSSGKDAWLVGKTFLGTDPQRMAPLILSYSDSQKRWENLSRNFSSYLNGKSDETYNFPSISKVGITPTGCTVIAAEQRTVFQTCDHGKSWSLIKSHGNSDRPMSINQISVRDNRVDLLEATGGVEGTGSLLTTFDFPPTKTHPTIALSSYFLTNASWVSESEIIVAGERQGNPLKDASENERKNRDVILHTIDGGNTWSEVFSHPFDRTRGTFFFAGERTIWLIDENGVIHRIAKS